jgi:hypothetical protein
MISKLALVVGVVALAGVAPASAAIVDFEALPVGNNPNPLILPEATFTTIGGFNFIALAATNGLCPSTSPSSPASCPLDLDVAFASAAQNISFNFVGNNDITIGDDIGDVEIFSGASLLGVVNLVVTDNVAFSKDLVSLTGFTNVTRLLISTTDFGGLIYDDFAFESSSTPVPEPSTLVMFGLAGAAARFRRRSSRRAS